MRPFLLAVAICSAVTPVASASGTFNVLFGSISVENGHHDQCVETQSGLCLASAGNASGGGTFVDANQEFHEIGLVVDRDFFEETPVYDLLPDSALSMRREDLEFPNPAPAMLATHVGRVRLPHPMESFLLYFNESEFGIDYHGPTLTPPDLSSSPHHHPYRYSPDGGIEYDRVGPPSDSADASTHDLTRMGVAACEDFAVADCAALRVGVGEADRLPNLLVGFEFHEIGAATNDSALHAGGAGDREAVPDAPLGSRESTVAAHLTRGPMAAAVPLARESPAAVAWVDPPAANPEPRAIPPSQGTTTTAQPPPSGAAVFLAAASVALALLVALLFSRFHREEALEHETRQRIVALLTKRGPTSFPELGRHLAADRTTVEHHVRLLVKTGFVTVTRGGRSTFALLPGQELDPALRRGQSQVAQTLVRILREHGGAMPRNALHAAAPTLSPRTRNGALTRLVTTGAIERAIEGNVEVVRLKAQEGRSSG